MSKDTPKASGIETMAEIDARIRKTFSALSTIVKGVIAGHLRSVVVSGAPGCSKTWTIEHELNRGQAMEKIKFNSVKGTMSAIKLYQALYTSQSRGDVLLIDDCDKIFDNEESLNILKASLDTGDVRMVHWNKESSILEQAGITSPFEFEGSVIFVTNKDFAAEIAGGSKMSVHYEALIDRSLYLDLGIHTRREIIVRISQVIFSDEFLSENSLTADEAKSIMIWLNKHQDELRAVSIRTVLHLMSLVKVDGSWESLADVMMLKR